MIDVLRGCLILVVVLCLGGFTWAGYMMTHGPYVAPLTRFLFVGGGFLLGLIVASVITGVCYLLLNINDTLEKIATQQD
ncbi:hypothetical protein A1OW_21605 [Enterovibrio norvegicus]|nr:hypothetical protein A1OW_21605 [Enterovibrio norvegicus]